MNKRPVDKSKKSNIKCEHCKFFIQDETANTIYNHNECTSVNSPKYGKGKVHYWNRCKQFEWIERDDKE